MARRIIIGHDGAGGFRIRTSMPGYDAATAPLDALLFDADALPGRILHEGEFFCDWWMYDGMSPGQAVRASVPHYASGNFIVIAIAKALYSDGSAPEDWRLKSRKIVNAVPTMYYRFMGGAAKGNYLTPFYISGDFGNGENFWWGWKLSWDGSLIHVDNWLANGLWVRFQVLEV